MEITTAGVVIYLTSSNKICAMFWMERQIQKINSLKKHNGAGMQRTDISDLDFHRKSAPRGLFTLGIRRTHNTYSIMLVEDFLSTSIGIVKSAG